MVFYLHKISCNYQQGYFAKVIEVEFNIYTIKEINTDQIKCKAQQKLKCQGEVKISYHQTRTDSIPYDQLIEDVKNQLKDIYQTKKVTETNNIFTTHVDVDKALSLKHLQKSKKWIRHNVKVDYTDPISLCGCMGTTTTKTIFTTRRIATTTTRLTTRRTITTTTRHTTRRTTNKIDIPETEVQTDKCPPYITIPIINLPLPDLLCELRQRQEQFFQSMQRNIRQSYVGS